jgi:hypothetical protein
MYAATAMLALQDDGLTATEIVQNIPHDGPALVVYTMLLIFAVLIWRGSRQGAG